jgi:SAM-dependent methyltransferase
MAALPDHRGFDESYAGVPPWDIGRAQPEVVRIADAGGFTGPAIDVGCGTGENTLELASRGIEIAGIDPAPRAIGKARAKAADRGLAVEFIVADGFALGSLGMRYASALDCGVFHIFDEDERPDYVASLASALEVGGMLQLLCFSDREPGEWGPHHLTERELRDTFSEGWDIRELVRTTLETNLPEGEAQAWRATIVHVG